MKRTIALLAAIAATAALAVVPVAVAGMAQVAGTSTPNPDGFSATMTGSLDGQWYLTGADPFWGGGTQVIVTGTELFVGTIDGRSGWLEFAFRLESRFDPNPPYPLIPNGRCQHHVIASGGELEGTTGYIQMKDRYDDGGAIVTTYKGHLNLPDGLSTLRAVPQATVSSPAVPEGLDTVLATCGG